MRQYRLSDLTWLPRTPAGRHAIYEGIRFRLWPFASRIARVWRKTAIRRTRVVAVVGSLGKSTTTRAVMAVLDLRAPASGPGNAWSSLAWLLLSIRPGQAHAAIEAGISRPGTMEGYARMMLPNATVVTSIASEHNRSFGSLEATRDEKAWMVRVLRPDGVAVLNGDDPHVMWMRGETRARVVTYGFGVHCDVRGSDVAIDWPAGTRFRVHVDGVTRDARVRFIGRHLVYPALAAIAVARAEGVPLDTAIDRLANATGPRGRMQPVELPGGVMVLRDEVKSTLETIHTALETFAEIPAKRRIVVLGDISEPMGSQNRLYRDLGRRAALAATHVVVAGGSREKLQAGAHAAGLPRANLIEGGRTPSEIASFLRGFLEPGDVVLIKGRDTQRLDRVRLILAGRAVRCDVRTCPIRRLECANCPMLERGWAGERTLD